MYHCYNHHHALPTPRTSADPRAQKPDHHLHIALTLIPNSHQRNSVTNNMGNMNIINNNINKLPLLPFLGDVTLEELEEKHFPVFERMCKDLNSKRPGEWWDFERLASCYDKISLTDRNSLKNEFQNGGGIPSDVLMSHIKTKYPDHTVRHLVRNLQRIGRDDIAQRLIPYTVRKPSSAQGY